jgi:hypothetical protein
MRRRGDSQTRAVLGVVVGMAVLGVPVGVLWWLIAPRADVTVVDGGITLSETASQTFVAADGWFAALTLVAGMVCGGFAAIRRRPDGALAAIALAAGGILAALLAWRVGVFLGRSPDALAQSASAAVGTKLRVALKLRATGVLLIWAIGALGTFFAAALATDTPEPEHRLPLPPAN